MELQIFTNEKFGTIRRVEINGDIYFVAADVCGALELTNPTMVVARLDEDERAKFNLGHPYGEVNVVNEAGLYRLIFASRKPDAKKFQRWIYHEVIPAIRKYGYYSIDHCKEIANNPEILIQVGLILKAEKEKVAKLETENAVLTQQVAELTPKATYSDLILQCKDVIPISVIAKDYGLSAKRLNKLLNKFGVQYKINGTWLLYQKYAKLGWTRTKTYNYNENCSKVLTYWTQQGRFGLYGILKQNGYLPKIELGFTNASKDLNVGAR